MTTKQIINENFVIADLPGYGYAGVSDKMQRVWQKNLEEYLLKRSEIVSLIQFIDSRHPVQKNDLQMAEWINYNKLPAFGICAKVDEISKNSISNTLKQFSSALHIDFYPFSKMTDRYNQDILQKFDEIIKSVK